MSLSSDESTSPTGTLFFLLFVQGILGDIWPFSDGSQNMNVSFTYLIYITFVERS